MNKWILLVALGLSACSTGINMSVTAESEPQGDPLEVKDPMSQDNQRIIDDAKQDGRLDQYLNP
ncbi:hypothetical protein [Shewanella aegiceratis]|uniref:hypothetical protein n=1 Tax=Shewanella aegiceratis TaxID=2864203 RepID=UPI001C65927C|nr:hypothetical protein [Shewanella aegiceratis]QYJ83361.1 hypothetical protein K0H80_04850 [Shewanella aegiceratis]